MKTENLRLGVLEHRGYGVLPIGGIPARPCSAAGLISFTSTGC